MTCEKVAKNGPNLKKLAQKNIKLANVVAKEKKSSREPWGRLLVNLVPMLEQKKTICILFFKLGSAQRCHCLGSEKWHFSGKKDRFSQI